jgi:hypothetical protein
MANKSGGASKVGQALNYKNSKRWESNRRKRLMNLELEQPNNAQIGEALKNLRYRRRVPTAPFWSHSRIRIAQLFKRFRGAVDMGMFNNNEKVSTPAILSYNPRTPKQKPFSEKGMFSIAERLRYN